MKRIHLVCTLIALLILSAVLTGGYLYATSLESRYIHVLAPKLLRQTRLGSALQKEAFAHPDLLPIYGSSEISTVRTNYDAATVFRAYPTGFAPFEVANRAVNSLVVAKDLAGVGSALRGKKVVVSFTHSIFFDGVISPSYYQGNFSVLHACELAFSSDLSRATKRLAARRMLDYPDSLNKEPLLRFALRQLADDSWRGRVLYAAVWPLGKLRTFLLELQDHWETIVDIREQPDLNPNVPHQPGPIDWPALEAKADRSQPRYSNNNPYGFDNEKWRAVISKRVAKHQDETTPQAFLTKLQAAKEWTDLDILLRVLTELGAEPLLVIRPIPGPYWEAMGVTQPARKVYYDRLAAAAQAYGVPIVDFVDHDMDPYFSIDHEGHTSRTGWVAMDKVLDQFYHDNHEGARMKDEG
jgi:D-alanine transfer protein